MRRRSLSALRLVDPSATLARRAAAILDPYAKFDIVVSERLPPGGKVYATMREGLAAGKKLGRHYTMGADGTVPLPNDGGGPFIFDEVDVLALDEPERPKFSHVEAKDLFAVALKIGKEGTLWFQRFPADVVMAHWPPLLNRALQTLERAVVLDDRLKDKANQLADVLALVSTARPEYAGPRFPGEPETITGWVCHVCATKRWPKGFEELTGGGGNRRCHFCGYYSGYDMTLPIDTKPHRWVNEHGGTGRVMHHIRGLLVDEGRDENGNYSFPVGGPDSGARFLVFGEKHFRTLERK